MVTCIKLLPVEKVSSVPGGINIFSVIAYWGVIYLQSNTYLLPRVWSTFWQMLIPMKPYSTKNVKQFLYPRKWLLVPFPSVLPSPLPCQCGSSKGKRLIFTRLDMGLVKDKDQRCKLVAQTTGWLEASTGCPSKALGRRIYLSCALTRQVQENTEHLIKMLRKE